DNTIRFAFSLASTAADLLNIESSRTRGSQHSDQIDVRYVEAIRENHHADECGQSPGAEVFDDTIAFRSRRLAQHHFAIDAASAKFVTYHPGVLDSDAVDQPRPTRTLVAGDLVAGMYDDVALNGRRLKLLGDELTAALADAGNIDG